MAQQQFNSWDPTRSGLEGNMQAEPRVFAHDAQRITVGALNCSDANYGISLTEPGEDFVPDETMDITHGGLDAVLTVLTTNPVNGSIATYRIDCDNVGSGYAVGDVIAALTGSIAGFGAAIVVTNIDIPKTQKRGCCLYNGSVASQAVIVVMEAATYDGSVGTGYDQQVTFANVPSGAFLPIQVVQLVSGTNVLALY